MNQICHIKLKKFPDLAMLARQPLTWRNENQHWFLSSKSSIEGGCKVSHWFTLSDDFEKGGSHQYLIFSIRTYWKSGRISTETLSIILHWATHRKKVCRSTNVLKTYILPTSGWFKMKVFRNGYEKSIATTVAWPLIFCLHSLWWNSCRFLIAF